MALESVGLYPIEIDIYKKHAQASLVASEGDYKGRGMIVTLMNDGAPLNSAVISLKLAFKTVEDEERLYDFESFDDGGVNKYRIYYPQELLEGQGGNVVPVEIKAFEGETVLSYLPLYVYVYSSISLSDIMGSDEGNMLLSAIATVENLDAEYLAAEAARDASYASAEGSRNASYNTAESARNSSYSVSEAQRNDDFDQNESARTAQENARVTAESARATAETARETAESTRATNESGRASAESGRATGEINRNTAESGRVSAESARATAESGRVSAEDARETAESARASAEATRASQETARENAETAREGGEQSRISAESARATAESARASAESSRNSAETARASAETARTGAESVRVANENDRILAENARNYYVDRLEDVEQYIGSIALKNKFPSPYFEDISGWDLNNATTIEHVTTSPSHWKVTLGSYPSRAERQIQIDTGKIYYFRTRVEVSPYNAYVSVSPRINGSQGLSVPSGGIQTKDLLVDFRDETTPTAAFYMAFGDANVTYTAHEAILIDVTDLINAANVLFAVYDDQLLEYVRDFINYMEAVQDVNFTTGVVTGKSYMDYLHSYMASEKITKNFRFKNAVDIKDGFADNLVNAVDGSNSYQKKFTATATGGGLVLPTERVGTERLFIWAAIYKATPGVQIRISSRGTIVHGGTGMEYIYGTIRPYNGDTFYIEDVSSGPFDQVTIGAFAAIPVNELYGFDYLPTEEELAEFMYMIYMNSDGALQSPYGTVEEYAPFVHAHALKLIRDLEARVASLEALNQ